MDVPSIPDRFQNLIDELAALADKRLSPCDYPMLRQFEDWLIGDGYEFALNHWKDDLVALNLIELAKQRFSDSELLCYVDIGDDEIDDSVRIDYAKDRIGDELEPGVETYAYTIHQLPIISKTGITAILGYKMQMIDLGEFEFSLHGVYSTEEDFLDDLLSSGFYLQNMSDQDLNSTILALWQKAG